MAEPCIIKSTKHGLGLILDNQIGFEDLVLAICHKFAASRDFFGDTNLYLTVEGRDLTGEELGVIVEAIQLNSGITINLIEQHNELFDARMAGKIDRFYFDEFYQNAKIITGSVARDEEVLSEGSILILGDVKKGGLVRAHGNVIVMGVVKGEVFAGINGEKSAYIVANAFESEYISIAGISEEVVTVESSFFKRNTKDPHAVVLWEGELVVEPLSKGIVKQLVK